MSFESQLENLMFSSRSEKTFVDKVLAQDDISALQNLIKKPVLTREELLEILYLLVGKETKLLNFDGWDRYLQLKFFVWIREFVKILEILFDYEDDLKIKQNTCAICGLPIKSNNDIICNCTEQEKKAIITLSKRAERLLQNNKLLMQHNAKFLVDLYLNIARTTMSLGAVGFMETLKNKFELYYPNLPGATTADTQRRGIFGIGGK